jgi:thiamine biosynthesis lipoprotein
MKNTSLISAFTFLMLTSCISQVPVPKKYLTGEAQGTYYAITYFDEQDRDMQHEVDSMFLVFDHSVSLWDMNSLINRINRNDTTVIPDDFFIQNFMLASDISKKTEGYFDFTIGPLVKMWGFGLQERVEVTPEMVQKKLKLVDYRNVHLLDGRIVKDNPEILFDFNAIAQGYSVDYLAQLFLSKGIDRFIIDVGGEIYASKTKPDGSPWVVGVEHPAKDKNDLRSIQQLVKLTNRGLATSGSYRNYYEENGKRYSHIIDVKTGYPVTHNLLSVTVLAEKTAIADGYCTAFLAMGVEKSLQMLEQLDGIEAYFIFSTDTNTFETFATDGFLKIMEVDSFE